LGRVASDRIRAATVLLPTNGAGCADAQCDANNTAATTTVAFRIMVMSLLQSGCRLELSRLVLALVLQSLEL